MEITRIKVTRELSRTTCEKCGKIINGTSDKLLKHNYEMHKIYCDKKKEVKKK